ncbi:phospho-sugar mutase [Nocardia miyunensis]|uniref:phospho-sugar mutase n=1 Tax=Nocardia miyunensis TaxID=282684 RepID=UPI000A0694E8|nr:phospho-sugar mutase [Nocardia miyunensis]
MLRFGTAGLRGPLRDGPDGMNVNTVLRATAGLAEWLRERCLGGGVVIVGRDARHGSAEFATATAEVLAAAGFSVLPLPRPLPTPVVAFAVRELGAVAGVQITASHNPATDNGYKVYLSGGSQLIPPADAEIERHIEAVRDPVPRADPLPTSPDPQLLALPPGTPVADLGEEIVRRYLDRVATLPVRLGDPGPLPSTSGDLVGGSDAPPGEPDARSSSAGASAAASGTVFGHDSLDDTSTTDGAARITTTPADGVSNPLPRNALRIALTPMHGVGGELAVAALHAAGFTDVQAVVEQFAPDPDFPTVGFPNPEEPGASDLLLALADRIDADLAIALDPDADRCAVGLPGPDGYRMLRGDETGVLLGDFVLRHAPADALVATTIVSSRLLSKLAPARGARYAETLTGFKWLARAGSGMIGSGPEAAAERNHAGPPIMPRLVYAYEEAIGHCVDPAAVRDKDGISAAVAVAELVARLRAHDRGPLDLLDDYALEFGLHAGDQVSLRLTDQAAAAQVLARLRENPPDAIAGTPVTCTDMARVRGPMRTDALIFTADALRIVVRPSGTEPKLKCYLEVVEPVSSRAALPGAKRVAAQRLSDLRKYFENL